MTFIKKNLFSAKTFYKTDYDKLLAIIKVFKIEHYYLKNCKYKYKKIWE